MAHYQNMENLAQKCKGRNAGCSCDSFTDAVLLADLILRYSTIFGTIVSVAMETGLLQGFDFDITRMLFIINETPK